MGYIQHGTNVLICTHAASGSQRFTASFFAVSSPTLTAQLTARLKRLEAVTSHTGEKQALRDSI